MHVRCCRCRWLLLLNAMVNGCCSCYSISQSTHGELPAMNQRAPRRTCVLRSFAASSSSSLSFCFMASSSYANTAFFSFIILFFLFFFVIL
jgi:hypothetical protein